MTIVELEDYFKSATQPDSVVLTPGVKVVNVPVFIEGHLEVIRNYPNAVVFSAFYERLLQLADIIESSKTAQPLN